MHQYEQKKKGSLVSEHTTEPVKPGWTAQVSPEFCEIPALYPAFGIRRTMAFRGIKEGWFKSVLLRQPGNTSGKRLVHVDSVRKWLKSKMEEK